MFSQLFTSNKCFLVQQKMVFMTNCRLELFETNILNFLTISILLELFFRDEFRGYLLREI